MSTADITKDHVEKMVSDAKRVAECKRGCKHTVSESNVGGDRFFTITHESGDAIDSHTMPAATMDLMEESVIANWLLSRHETTRLAKANG